MLDALRATLCTLITHYYSIARNEFFGPSGSWTDTASAIANIVMAFTGIAAAFYGLGQFRNSVKVAEFDAVMRLNMEINSVHAMLGKAAAIQDNAQKEIALGNARRAILNLCEANAGALNDDVFSGLSKKFVADFLASSIGSLAEIEPFKAELAVDPEQPGRYHEIRAYLKRKSANN